MLFNTLKWLPFYAETLINKCAILYRRIEHAVPEYLMDSLKLNSSRHPRNTGFASLNFITPTYKRKTEGGSSFVESAIQDWNNLNCEIRKQPRVKSLSAP